MGLIQLINIFFLLLLVINLHSNIIIMRVTSSSTTRVSSECSTTHCGDSGRDTDIRFPFKLSGSEPSSCGYTGFDLMCDQRPDRTLIELPSSGNFSVKSIDYIAQEIWVNDLNNCLPKKLITLNLSNSPFSMIYYEIFSFFNCSSTLIIPNNNNNNNINNNNNTININNNTINFKESIIGPIPCLSGLNYFIYAIPLNNNNSNNNNNNKIGSNNVAVTYLSTSKCYMFANKVKVPVHWLASSSTENNETGLSSISKFDEDVRLSWFMPECQSCELHGRMCTMKTNSSGFDVILCSNVTTTQGRPRTLSLIPMIAVILVICSPSIICIVGSLYIWVRSYITQTGPGRSREGRSREEEQHLGFEGVNVVQLGLRTEPDPEPGSEFAHTIALSEIVEEEMGPSPWAEPGSIEEENVCTICMVEYKVNDKMGTLPICGHYFHANCINEWFISRGVLDRTCPICRARVGSGHNSTS